MTLFAQKRVFGTKVLSKILNLIRLSAQQPPTDATAAERNFNDLKQLVAAQLRHNSPTSAATPAPGSAASKSRATAADGGAALPSPQHNRFTIYGAAAAAWLRRRLSGRHEATGRRHSRRSPARRQLGGQLAVAAAAADAAENRRSTDDDGSNNSSSGSNGKVNRIISQLEASGHPLRMVAGAGPPKAIAKKAAKQQQQQQPMQKLRDPKKKGEKGRRRSVGWLGRIGHNSKTKQQQQAAPAIDRRHSETTTSPEEDNYETVLVKNQTVPTAAAIATE